MTDAPNGRVPWLDERARRRGSRSPGVSRLPDRRLAAPPGRADNYGMIPAARPRGAPERSPGPGADAPPGWLLERDAMGREALVRDRKGNAAGAAVLAGAATAIVLFAVLLSREPAAAPPSPAAVAISVLLVGGMSGTLLFFATLLAFGRVSIVPRDGIVESRLDLFGLAFVRSQAVEWLHVERDTGSDNRNRFDLVAVGEGRRLPLETSKYSSDTLVALARWLAARLGVPLDIDDGFPAISRRRAAPPGLDEIRAARARGKGTPR